MEQDKKQKGRNALRRLQTVKQLMTTRQVWIATTASIALIVLLFFIFNFAEQKEAKASPTTETLSTGSFIIDMGVTPQTVANGLKPYGMLYDLINNYYVPVKWVIESTKLKDSADFTYNLVQYKGGPFIIPAEYITADIAARITYWQTQGVQGLYTISPLTVPVYMTITNYPLIMIDTLSGNQPIIIGYYNNAGIPSSAYTVGSPNSLNTCHDMWVNPHGDPTWATHNYLYDFVTVQKSYIWSQCHAVSNLEGCQNTSSPFQRLNYLTTNGMKCWKLTGGGASYCGPSITQTHPKNPTSPYSYFHPAEPVAQFMGTMSGSCLNGSEQWFQPQSTGTWRPTTMRIVTTAAGTSPGEGVLMVYGPAYGDSTYGKVMYTSGHDFTLSGSVTEQVAVQRSFLNFMLLAGKAKQVLISSYIVPTNFTGLQPQQVSVTVSSGIGPYTYRWTSTVPGYFVDSTAATTNFVPDNSTTSGIIRCIITDACGRQNFAIQLINVTASPLPVKLTSFSAQAVSNTVMLRWTTASELNNDYFTLERSRDGYEFTELTKVKGAGTTPVTHHYSFTDNDPANGVSYYRLKQTDFDGKSEQFSPVAVKLNRTSGAISAIVVTPNPFINEFTAQFNSDESKTVTVELITLRSKVLHAEKIILEPGTNTYRFNGGSQIETGVYVFRILQGNTLLGYCKAVKK
jgi:hypothetical protein